MANAVSLQLWFLSQCKLTAFFLFARYSKHGLTLIPQHRLTMFLLFVRYSKHSMTFIP